MLHLFVRCLRYVGVEYRSLALLLELVRLCPILHLLFMFLYSTESFLRADLNLF